MGNPFKLMRRDLSEKVHFLRGSTRPPKGPAGPQHPGRRLWATEVFAGRQHLAMLLWVVVEIIIVLSDPWTGKNRNRSSAVFRRLPIVVKYGSRAALFAPRTSPVPAGATLQSPWKRNVTVSLGVERRHTG